MGEAGFPLVLVHFAESLPSTGVILSSSLSLSTLFRWLMLATPVIRQRKWPRIDRCSTVCVGSNLRRPDAALAVFFSLMSEPRLPESAGLAGWLHHPPPVTQNAIGSVTGNCCTGPQSSTSYPCLC